MQGAAPGTPSILLYPAFPEDRLEKMPSIGPPWASTDTRLLTVRVAYDQADVTASRNALACHKSQFASEDIEPLTEFMSKVLNGQIYLRPWAGAATADDVFKVKIP